MKKLFLLCALLMSSIGRVRLDGCWYLLRKVCSLSTSVFLAVGLACFPCLLFAQNRYIAGDINAEADGFYSRFNEPLINVDFIIVSAKSSAGQKVDAALDGAEIEQTAAGSVIIEPGVDIGDAVIVNINNGSSDNIAIGD